MKSRGKGTLGSDETEQEKQLATGKGITVNDWSNMCSTHSNNADYSLFFFVCHLIVFPLKKNLIPNKIHFGNGCGKQTVIPLFGFYSKVYKSHERMLTDPKVTLGKTVLTVMS